ncbi:hypothetical protein LVB77_02140 [Lysobacter sp. 5GHs7-4]|uniref:hypothetical protein n=1 Tax=Lysobacter sp. 5GHs7-4 TaxID=2904253 RepID=UPI001E323556|nr:hypothetical protein [Lysobacter sp. 5GHs7-4]UHQ23537.1 hypothetical protein LVB77_02140 [Lysobacter sp. 5GHs7-4]
MRTRVWIAAALALAATAAGFGWREARQAGVDTTTQVAGTDATRTRPVAGGDTPNAGAGMEAAASPSRPWPAGCDVERADEELAASDRERALAMARQPDARSRLFAAYLLDGVGDDEVALAARESARADALRLPSEDPLLLWAQVSECEEEENCRRAEALAALQALEPDNAAVWLAGLRYSADGDAERLAANDALLRRAAQARHYRTAFGDFGQAALTAWSRVPMAPPSECAMRVYAARNEIDSWEPQLYAGARAMDLAVVTSLPSYGPLMELCRSPPRERRDVCLSVFGLMARSPDLIDRVMGQHGGTPLAADGPDALAWRERVRELSWLSAQFPGMRGRPLPPDWFERVFRLGEMPALEAWLTEQGLPTRPPPNWLPDNPRQRALILTGRPPPSSAPAAR